MIEGFEAANPELWTAMPDRVPSICTAHLQTQARRFSMQGTDQIDSVAAPFCSARTSFCFTKPKSLTSAAMDQEFSVDTTLPISALKLAAKAKKIDTLHKSALASARAFVTGCDQDEWACASADHFNAY